MKKKAGMWAVIGLVILLLTGVVLWLTADKENTVGICYRGGEDTAYRQQLQEALNAKGFEVIAVDAHGDQAKQLQQIGELKKKKCDVLLIEPVMQDASRELLTAIGSTELPAVLFNRQFDTALLQNASQIAYVGVDEARSGQLQAQMMENLPAGGDINGDGTVSYLLIQGPESHSDTIARTGSLEQQLQKSGLTCHRLAMESGDWTQDSGRKICKQQLAAFGKDIEVILCGNDQMAVGAYEAIADGGRTVGKDVYLLAIGGEGDILQMVSEGKISGTVYLDTAVQVEAIAETVLAQFRQQPAETVKILPYSTKEN